MPLKATLRDDGSKTNAFRIDSILESATFQKSPTLRNLLEFLWKERDSSISEYAIAVGALGRKPDFDAKYDSTVRVQVSRLRQKLKEYYDHEGKHDAVVLQIPLGAHTLRTEEREQAAIPDPAIPLIAEAPDLSRPSNTFLLRALCVILAVACGYLLITRQPAKTISGSLSPKQPGAATIPAFWPAFLSNGKPVAIYLPTPIFFEWETPHIKVRDTDLNGFEWEKSPEISRLARQWGTPRILSNYAVIFDALAAVRLTQFLQSQGVSVSAATTLDMAIDTVGQQNTILLGTPSISGSRLNGVINEMNFRFGKNWHQVLNRDPKPSEPRVFAERIVSHTQIVELGIIAHLPGEGDNGNLLVFISQHTATLVAQLISPASSGAFEQAWRQAGSPRYFEAVVEAEMEGKTPLRTRVAALRETRIAGWHRRIASR